MRHTSLAAVLLCALVTTSPAAAWRSSLYPADWTPSFTSANGGFLHDFSYAGYAGGERAIPTDPGGAFVDVTLAPYLADGSGVSDATAAIQSALDDVGALGGGVVYLPAGSYRVRPATIEAPAALHIRHSGVVLRGAGPTQTFLINDEPDLRGRQVLLLAPPEGWRTWEAGAVDERLLAADAAARSDVVRLTDASGIEVGAWLVVRADATAEYIAEHGMTGTWTPDDTTGPLFYRQVVDVDVALGDVTLDAPLRYPLLTRDAARVARVPLHLDEVGVEQLALGNMENDTPGTGDEDYTIAGTGAYQVHASFLVMINHVVDGWLSDVSTFRPSENAADVHLLSNGVRVDFSRRVTLRRVRVEKPQYKGEGGNGNLFVLMANDCSSTTATPLMAGTTTRSRFRGAQATSSCARRRSRGGCRSTSTNGSPSPTCSITSASMTMCSRRRFEIAAATGTARRNPSCGTPTASPMTPRSSSSSTSSTASSSASATSSARRAPRRTCAHA